jgi:soluble cytochrome b562
MKRMSIGLAIVLAFSLLAGGAARLALADEHGGPLHDSMEAMNKAYKTLRMQIADASKNASSLELVSEMQKQALIAKSAIPARAKATPEAQRAKFISDYRKSMVMLMTELLKLETALVDGKNADAEAIAKNLTKMKNEEHEKFQEE